MLIQINNSMGINNFYIDKKESLKSNIISPLYILPMSLIQFINDYHLIIYFI